MNPVQRKLLLLGFVSALIIFGEVCAAKKKKKAEKNDEDNSSESERAGRGIWIGLGSNPGWGHHHHGPHTHGWKPKHGWHSTKLSEAYVQFHNLGEKDTNRGGLFGRLGTVLNRIAGRGQTDEGSGWGGGNSGNNNGDNKGGNNGGNNNNKQVGWAAGDFQTYKPPRRNNRNKGHLELPTGWPAYIQQLRPILDLKKVPVGWGWRR